MQTVTCASLSGGRLAYIQEEWGLTSSIIAHMVNNVAACALQANAFSASTEQVIKQVLFVADRMLDLIVMNSLIDG